MMIDDVDVEVDCDVDIVVDVDVDVRVACGYGCTSASFHRPMCVCVRACGALGELTRFTCDNTHTHTHTHTHEPL